MNANQTQKRTILVVDDEPLVCETVTMLLQMDGHKVAEAGSGAEALKVFQPGKFDVIFTDYFMPAMKGDELAAAIKKQAPAQPVVMLTAYPEKLRAPTCPKMEVDLFLSKPFELSNLRDAIDRYAPVPKLEN